MTLCATAYSARGHYHSARPRTADAGLTRLNLSRTGCTSPSASHGEGVRGARSLASCSFPWRSGACSAGFGPETSVLVSSAGPAAAICRSAGAAVHVRAQHSWMFKPSQPRVPLRAKQCIYAQRRRHASVARRPEPYNNAHPPPSPTHGISSAQQSLRFLTMAAFIGSRSALCGSSRHHEQTLCGRPSAFRQCRRQYSARQRLSVQAIQVGHTFAPPRCRVALPGHRLPQGQAGTRSSLVQAVSHSAYTRKLALALRIFALGPAKRL